MGKLPTPIIGEMGFHKAMVLRYSRLGLPHFISYHADEIKKLTRMREKLE